MCSCEGKRAGNGIVTGVNDLGGGILQCGINRRGWGWAANHGRAPHGCATVGIGVGQVGKGSMAELRDG